MCYVFEMQYYNKEFVDKFLGKKFCKLTIIGKNINRESRNARILCRCVCKKEKLIRINDLLSKRVTSCGDKIHRYGAKLNDLTGKKFSMLLVIRREKNNKHGQPMWLCKCDCGNQKIVLGLSLRSKKTKSCGCLKVNNLRPLKYIMHNYVKCANDRKLCFGLTLDEFHNLIKSNCHYCGCAPQQKRRAGKHIMTINGIDRINNNIGYIKNNVVSCCKVCNWMKKDLSIEKFIEHCKTISSRF